MASTADTLTATGAPVDLGPPPHYSNVVFGPAGGPYAEAGYVALPGQDEVVVLWMNTPHPETAVLTGYSLSGTQLFQKIAVNDEYDMTRDLLTTSVFSVGSYGEFGVAVSEGFFGARQDSYQLYYANGTSIGSGRIDPNNETTPAVGSDTPTGFHLEWTTIGPAPGYRDGPRGAAWADFSATGSNLGTSRSDAGSITPYAATAVGSHTLTVRDNQVMLDGTIVTTAPGEPAHAMTGVATEGLADGQTAAVTWADSGTDYVSIFNASTGSFGAQIVLDWGGAKDSHVLALADGGFAVSWQNGGQYKGELFTADGTGGGILSLTGQFGALKSDGGLYTVGLNSDGAYVVQTYAVNSGGGTGGTGGSGGNSSSVSTSDPNYTAPDGVTTITLTGSNQTIHANNAGDTINSDNTVNHLYGGTGADIFHLGRGGDIVAGGGGADTFAYAENPWNGGVIADFSSDDAIDLTGLLSRVGYAGSDPIVDGYLKIANDGNGNAQVWSDTDGSGSGSGWWLVASVQGVSADRLQIADGVITERSSSVTTAAANYTAPSYVNSITLTGSQQTVHASTFQDTTVWSDNTGNTIYGSTGDDVIHVGRGGDTVNGGPGADTFVFDENPWAAATIGDFDMASGDTINVSGLLARAGYTGSDPVADGYLKIGDNQILANMHQPGDDGWWVVANVSTATLAYADGVISSTTSPAGRTVTTSTGGGFDGASTVILTGSNTGISANNGGDTLIDQGEHNALSGAQGNDTLVFGPSTTTADGWGGADTFVINPHPTVETRSSDLSWIGPGSRIDVHNLLNGIGYSGADPVSDGHVWIQPPAPSTTVHPGMAPRPSELMWDPDGAAGPTPATGVYLFFGTPAHYQDGLFLFG